MFLIGSLLAQPPRLGQRPRFFLGCHLRTGQLQEDFFQAHRGRPQLIQIPAGFHDGARQIAANEAILQAFHFKDRSVVAGFLQQDAADAVDGFQAMLDGLRVERAAASLHFQHHRFGAARAILQVVHRIRRHQLALVDDEHLLAGLLHFGQDVRAQDDGVVAGQAADQIARFVDLLGVQPGGGLVENQNVGVVDDGLRQSDALPVAFGQLADQFGADVGDGAALGDFSDAVRQARRPTCPSAFRQM